MTVAALRSVVFFAACLAWTAWAVGCDRPCSRIRQTVLIDKPNADLKPLVDVCASHKPGPNERCAGGFSTEGANTGSIECGCLPLCRAVMEIVDQYAGPEAIEKCDFQTPLSSFSTEFQQASTRVTITFRPSTCQ